ncbi:co-chaperone DjlA [Oceanospirillum linum]|uniref:Molecular chaperone DjlA n=1 Tax=Oceanospirillum linum TaxID=966 RepID=A0A1T1HF50_OCELI|nr:co-chaperone DjlA [Oceanospirillum linum]OOV88481.1 molecular chaperone DjlA [Oceanospirillum linum]SMP06144.1 DnaJ like chaperone protein [Oceanospirillum linum]
MKYRFPFSLKITGLLTGMLTWGWKGMIIGFLLGYLLDRKLTKYFSKNTQPPYGKRYRSKDEQLFFQITFQMLGYLAKANGKVSQQEISITEHIMSSMALSGDERLAAITAFNIGKNQQSPPNHLLKLFRKRFKHRTGKKAEWLHYQFQLLYAEGRAEVRLVETLGMSAFYAGISPEQFQTLRQQYRMAWQESQRRPYNTSFTGSNTYQAGADKSREHREHKYQYRHQAFNNDVSPGAELAAAYHLLGISPDADSASLKKAFRQKISKVHPDKLAGRNASPEEQTQAKELSQQLQSAYQRIKESRKAL